MLNAQLPGNLWTDAVKGPRRERGGRRFRQVAMAAHQAPVI
jgi:hypothetical protein